MFAKKDPGPCPVDDAPHTTCTSPDYDPATGRSVLAITVLPARDGARSPRSAHVVRGSVPHGAFSTRTYTRAAARAAIKAVSK